MTSPRITASRLLPLLLLVALLPACATDPGNPFGAPDPEQERGRGELHQEACDGPPTTAGMRACEQGRLTRATEELAAVLAELGPLLDGPRAELLEGSQRTWEEHRAAYCRFVSARYEGGSLQPVLLTSCFARVTSARVRELRAQLRLEREQGEG